MAQHDLVRGGEIVETRHFDTTPTLAANKGAWLPRHYPNPDFQPGPGEVLVETVTIEADRVVYTKAGQNNLPALKAAFRLAVDARRDQAFAEGFTPSTGPLSGKVLACRSAEDRTNWLTMQGRLKAGIAAGAGAVVAAKFRTVANENITVSLNDGDAVLDALAQWGQEIYDRSWVLKDTSDAAANFATFDAISATLNDGWPE
jgi:hypothetical protein